MKYKKGYKIVRKNRNSMLIEHKSAIVCYKKRKWVKPNGFHGPLAVFKEKKHAYNLFNINPRLKLNDYRILPCKYEECTWCDHLYIDICAIDRFTYSLPPGTVLASKVKVLS